MTRFHEWVSILIPFVIIISILLRMQEETCSQDIDVDASEKQPTAEKSPHSSG